MTNSAERFTLFAASSRNRLAAFSRDVRIGLTHSPKFLSCCYFYDAEGSQLFEDICDLPEYYLTRAERAIFEAHADEWLAPLPAGTMLVELGSGNAAKTRLLIERLLRRQDTLQYVPIDICRVVLEESARALLADFPHLTVTALAAEYQEGLRHLQSLAAPAKLLLWLGSNIGNFDRPDAIAFLRQVRECLTPADRLLVGIDLRKDRSILEPAYDDAQGVTAAFNRNLLTRINHELGGHFDEHAFDHLAIYNDHDGRIEMYLVSRRPQRVRIDQLDLELTFEAGERVHTENSYKYSLAEIQALADAAGYRIVGQWFDPQRWFSVQLLARA